MGNQGSIEFQVNLGLQNAASQVQQLHQMLEKSVKVDSSAFKDIERFLNKISDQAAGLKEKMGDAFKTSGNAKSFLKQYEQLFSMLEGAKERLSSLGLKDIAFSGESQQQVESFLNKIKELENEISALEKGKIGNIFENSDLSGAEKIREIIQGLGEEAKNLTFSGLSSAISKELTGVEKDITSVSKSVETLKNQVNSLSTDKITDITKKVSEAMTKSIDPNKSTFKTENIVQYRQAIEDFYKQFSRLGDIDTAKFSGTFGKWFEQQAQNIVDGGEKIKEALPKAQQAFDQLKAIKDDPNLKGDAAKAKVQSVAEFLGIDFNAKDFDRYDQAIKALQQRITETLTHGFKDSKEVDAYAQNMIESLRQSFDKVDLNKVINVTNFKTSIKNIFKEIGISLKDEDISKIFNSISANIDMNAFTETLVKGLENYREKQKGVLEQTEKDLNEHKKNREELLKAQGTVKSQDAMKDENLAAKQAEILAVTQALQAMVNEVNAANGTHLRLVDDGSLQNGKKGIEQYIESLNKLESKQKALGNIQMAVNRWMGFYQVLNLTKRAISDMRQHIQELDTVMTQIAVVTNMSQEQLWGQIGKYSEIARSYGVAIKGVYEVSQIYYQQGLESNDVMTLTTETLKMARIAGLDYATAADYMTTAIRGFKLEMSDAAHVTDVFSALAASTASSTEELAVAISKTAASAANVGSSFEATSAMMATMIATTRESATNIGTALKSIISRYGEMTSKPNATTDSEGEEMSLNRVDKALQSIGITLHTTTGEFRNFDEVILELAEKWETLDSVSQRYIATIMAGNRQQSRFLALVSNVDEYKRALEVAQGSEGSGELQMLKTLDSVDAKLEKMRVTIQEFYTSSGLEQLYKNVIDSITNIISAANSLPKAFGKIPVQALAIGMSLVSAIKSIATLILSSITDSIEHMKHNTSSALEGMISIFNEKGRKMGQALDRGLQEGTAGVGKSLSSQLSKGLGLVLQYVGAGLSALGAVKTIGGINAYGASTTGKQDQKAGQQTGTGAVLSILGSAATGAAAGTAVNPGVGTIIGAVAGTLKGVVENLATLKSASDMYNVSLAREIELSQKRLEAAKTEEEKAKGEEKTLAQAYDKLTELRKHQYDSVEAMQEYTDYMNQLGENYPKFIESISANGDVLINATSLEHALADARKSAADATLAAAKAELDSTNLNKTAYEELQQNVNGLRGFDIQQLRFASGDALKYANKGYDQYGQLIAAYNERYGASLPIDQRWGQGETNNYNTIFAHQKEFMNYWNDLAAEGNEAILNYQRSQLKSMIDTFNTQHQDLNIAKQLGFDDNEALIESISSYSDFVTILNNIDTIASQYIDNAGEIVGKAEEAISRAEISQSVQDSITKLQKSSNTKEKEQGEQLQDYVSFLNFLFDTVPTEEELKHAEQLVLNNSKDAERLKNVDYSLLRGFDDLELGAFEEYSEQFHDDYYDYVEQLHRGFTTQLLNFGDSLDRTIFQKLAYGGKNGGIINKLFPAMRESLSKYSSLLENGLPALAENYRYGLEKFYSQLGTLTLAQQANIASLVPNIDFTDADSLISAAETLSEMGPEYGDLATILTTAAERFVGNAQLILTQVAETASDTAKAIETAIDNQGKIFKRSEALKNAQELLSNYTGEEEFDWTDLYTYDKELGGYFENENAFMVRMVNARTEAQKQVEKAQRAIDLESSIYNAGQDIAKYLKFNKEDWELESNKDYFSQVTFLTGADLDAAWLQFQQIVKEFNDQLETGEKDFGKYLKNRLDSDKEALKNVEQDVINLYKDMATDELNTYDYSKLVIGQGNIQTKTNLQSLLTQAIDPTKFKLNQKRFNEAYAQLLIGDLKSWNEYIDEINQATGSNIAHADQEKVGRAQFEAYYAAYQKIAGDESPLWTALDEDTQKLLTEAAGISQEDYTSSPEAAAEKLWQAILALINSGVASINEVTDTIASRANKAYGGTAKEKSYQLLDKYKDGLTSDELMNLQEGKGNLFLDDNGKLTNEAAQYLTYDNGKFVAKAGQDAASVLQFLAETLGFAINKNTEDYKEAIHEAVAEEISKADKADIGKQRVANWQSIMSANVGDRLDISEFDDTTKYQLQKAGLITKDIDARTVKWIQIQSEQSLNNAIDWMKQWLQSETNVKGSPQTARYFSSMVRDLEAKTAKNAAFEDIVGETVSQSAADTLSMALQNTTEYADVQKLMQDMGFKWDQAAQVWKASAESIKAAKSKITQAFAANEIDTETYTSLIASLNETANAIDPKTKQDNTILDMLQNYTNATEAMKAAFITNFDPSIYTYNINKLFKANDNGTYDVDVGALKSFLDSIGFKYDEAARSQIQTITDSYLSNIQTATTYVTQGASSLADVEAFKQSYANIVGQALSESAFQYNTLTQSFILDPAAMSNYINAQKKLLLGMGYAEEFVNAYITDQTDKAIQAGIELDSFLNANTSKERNDEANKLFGQIQGLSNYKDIARLAIKTLYPKYGPGLQAAMVSTEEEAFKAIMQVLENGDQAAVDLLKQIKPDASPEELEVAFNSQINKLNDAMNQVGDLVAGQFVGTEGKLYEILARVGAVDENGVVQAGFDMVAIYAAIYDEMTNTAGATTAGLNDAYAKLLTASDQQNVDIVDALQNTSGMTYEALGKMLANYGKSLTEFMANASKNGIKKTGFGKIKITDWNIFAQSVWGDNLSQIENTPEYINAFKEYSDGLKQAIVNGIKQIEVAKAGDILDLTEIDTLVQNTLTHRYDDFITNNIKNLGSRVEVGPEIMNEAFSGIDWFEPFVKGEYATIFGRTLTGANIKGLGKNIGISIAQIDEAGNAINNIEEYINDLVDQALELGQVIDIDTIRELDQKNKNLIMDIRAYSESLTDDQIWDSQDQITQAVHEAEELPKIINSYYQDLLSLGAVYEEGILKLGENADTLGIYNVFENLLETIQTTSNEDYSDQINQIKDSINNLINNYVDSLSNGFKGNLTNEQASSLKQIASHWGLSNNIQYTETANGLQLTADSALTLYGALNLTNKALSKKLLPDLMNMSKSYNSVQQVMASYVRMTDRARRAKIQEGDASYFVYDAKAEEEVATEQLTAALQAAALRAMYNSMLDDPETYKIYGKHPMNGSWQSSYNFGQSTKTKIDYVNAAKKGQMGLEEFYDAMGVIMDNSANNPEAAQWALNMLDKAPDYFTLDKSGNPIINTKLLGLAKQAKLFDSYLDASMSIIQEAGKKRQELFNELFLGSNSLDFTDDIWKKVKDKNGKDVRTGELNSEAGEILQDLLDNREGAGKQIYDILSKFNSDEEDNNRNLAEKIKQTGELTINEQQLIETLAGIDWELGDIESQLQEKLGKSGFGGTIHLDEDGNIVNIEVDYGNPGDWKFKYKVGDHEITGSYDSYQEIIMAELQKGFTDWKPDNNGGQFTTFEIAGQTITMTVSADGIISYSCNVNGKTVTADSMEGLKIALMALVEGYEGEDSTTTAAADSGKSHHITIDGENYEVTITGNVSKVTYVDENGKPINDKGSFTDQLKDSSTQFAEQQQASLDLGEVSEATATVKKLNVKIDAKTETEVSQEGGTADGVELNVIEKAVAAVKGFVAKLAEGAERLLSEDSYEGDGVPLDDIEKATAETEALEVSMKGEARPYLLEALEGPVALQDIDKAEAKVKQLEIAAEAIKLAEDGDIQGLENLAAVLQEIVNNEEIELNVKTNSDIGNTYSALNDIDSLLKGIVISKEALAEAINIMISVSGTDAAQAAADALNSIPDSFSRTYTITTKYITQGNPSGGASNISTKSPPKKVTSSVVLPEATGNVGLAKAKGTLLGELGPELVVSNGRYFVAGQSGAEMVDLADDAIVFNHLQTEQLLKKGMSPGRGKAVTDEKKAVAYAKGNINGRPVSSNTGSNFLSQIGKQIYKVVGKTGKTLHDNIKIISNKSEQIIDERKKEEEQLRKQQEKEEKKERIDTAKDARTKAERELEKAKENLKIARENGAPADVLQHLQEAVNKAQLAYKETSDEYTKLTNDYSKTLDNTVASTEEMAKAAQEAAQAQQDAAQAAEDLAKEERETARVTREANREAGYNSQTKSRGLVHPDMANDVHPTFNPINYGEIVEESSGSSSGGSDGGGSSSGSRTTSNKASNYSNNSNPMGVTTGQWASGGYGSRGSGGGGSSGSAKKANREGTDDDDGITESEAKSEINSFLNDLLGKGIEYIRDIGVEAYEKLTPTLKANIGKMVDSGAQYREFVTAYAGACNASMKEINQKYFEAWQKDLEAGGLAESQMDAVEGLSFFANGEIGGSASDWVEIFGNYGDVSKAVEAGVIQWNAQLRQYVVKDAEALKQYLGTNIEAISNFEDAQADQSQAVWDEIQDLLDKSMNEGLTNKEVSRLQAMAEKQGITIDKSTMFMKNSQGKLIMMSDAYKQIANKIDESSKQIEGTTSQVPEAEQNAVDAAASIAASSKKLIANKGEDGRYTIGNLGDIEAKFASNDFTVDEINDYMTDLESLYQLLTDEQQKVVEVVHWQLQARKNELMQSSSNVTGNGQRAFEHTDEEIKRIQEITQNIADGLTSNILSKDFEATQEQMKAAGIDTALLEGIKTSSGYNTTFDDIVRVYNAIFQQYPEEAAEMLKSVDDSLLNLGQRQTKSILLKNLGEYDAAAVVGDQIREVLSSMTNTIINGFGQDSFVSESDLQTLLNDLRSTGRESAIAYAAELEKNVIRTEKGIQFTWEQVMEYTRVMADNPLQVLDVLNKLDTTNLDNDQRAALIEMQKALGDNKGAAINTDAQIERIKETGELLKSGFGYGKVLTNEQVQQLKTNLTADGYKLTEEQVKRLDEQRQVNFDLIYDYISKQARDNPEVAREFLSDLDSSAYSIEELQKLYDVAAINGLKTEAAAIKDKIIEIINNISETSTKGISSQMSFAEFDELKTRLAQAGFQGLTEEDYKTVYNGVELTWSGVQKIMGELIAKGATEEAQAMLEAYNDRISEKIGKDNKTTSGALKTAVEDLTFIDENAIAGTIDQLKEIANIANVPLDQLLELAEWDEKLQKYIIKDKSKIENVDWDKIEQIQDTIVDGINEFISTLTDTIKNGIAGTLKNADITSMKGMLAQYGFGDVTLDFTKTTEGLKLSEQSAIRLYTILKQVDDVHARLVFTELNESLKKSNDNYETIRTTMAHIVELKEKIASAEARRDDTKVKQYKEELALAKEILAVRATQEDESMNFMDQDIPGALKNPLNYASSVTKAMQALREALNPTDENTKPGYLGYQDFYNIGKWINEQAGVLGKEIEWAGVRLNGSWETFGRLLEKGSQALTATESGEIKVSLEKLGIGLQSGFDIAADLTTEGMQTFAKSQIEVIDGLINFLETIVAMKDLENLDESGDGIINLPEIFSDKEMSKYTERYQTFGKQMLELAQEGTPLRKAIEEVKINGISVAKILEDAASGQKNVNLSAEELQQALQALYELSQSNDWDLNSIGESLGKILAGLNKDKIAITYGDQTVRVISGKVVVEAEKDGQTVYQYNGKEYTDMKQIYLEINQKKIEEIQAANYQGASSEEGSNIINVTFHDLITTTLELDSTTGQLIDTQSKKSYATFDEFVEEQRLKYNSQHEGAELSDIAFRAEFRLLPTISDTSDLTEEQIKALKDAGINSSKALEKAWGESEEDHMQFAIKYGFFLQEDEEGLNEDFKAKLNEVLADETKTVYVTATYSSESNPTVTQLLNGEETTATVSVNADVSSASTTLDNFKKNKLDQLKANVVVEARDLTNGLINDLEAQLDRLVGKTIKVEVVNTVSTTPTESPSSAKGTFGGVALAGGSRQTLMGELGPELYVSNGRYHIVGRNGAEFVSLPNDAIVFNHLQTARLLDSGKSGRGTPITNEVNAVSMARGNVGPAKASADAALAMLKSLRAAWESLAGMTTAQLAGKASQNSGGEDEKNWIATVERWYDYLQKIARLEKEINKEEALRNTLMSEQVAHGDLYYKSQLATLNEYKEQAKTYQALAQEQEAFFEKRRAELNAARSPFSEFYSYDEYGQIKYNEGGLEFLSSLMNTDEYGKSDLSIYQKYRKFYDYKDANGNYSLRKYMEYDSNGNRIASGDYEAAVQAIWERMEAEQQEMQALYDSKEDAKAKTLEGITSANKILEDIRKNQIDLENKVLEAIEAREQALIDKLSEEREQLQDASSKYVKGLQDALSKEREMYQQNNEDRELVQLQRRLAILQRSGGSQSDILNLQKQVQDKNREAYFDAQEAQIKAFEEASNEQLERMETQINIMTETLAFQKEHGLLQAEMNQILQGTSEAITAFITGNTKDWQAKTALSQEEESRQILFMAQQYETMIGNNPSTVTAEDYYSVFKPHEAYQHGSSPDIAQDLSNPDAATTTLTAEQIAKQREELINKYSRDNSLVASISSKLLKGIDSWNRTIAYNPEKGDRITPTNLNQNIQIVIEKLADGYDTNRAVNDVLAALQEQASKNGANTTIRR